MPATATVVAQMPATATPVAQMPATARPVAQMPAMDVQVTRTCTSSRHLKHCKGLFGIAATLAMFQPSTTFPSRANFRAPATGHLTHAVPRPYLVVQIFPTCTSALPHHAAEDSACRSSSLATEMSIPPTLNSAVLFGAATLTRPRPAHRPDASPVATPFLCLCRRGAG
jgi:hypothetical protein